MTINAVSVDDYLSQVPEDRKEALNKLRATITENLPDGFEECLQYKMPSYVVPKRLYPPGYHCTPEDPLPFISFASQKNFVALYHMGIYSMPKILAWFQEEYPKHSKRKLDMGKSCIRFKKVDDIPFQLIAQLVQKISVDSWIENYEKALKR